MRYLVAHSQPWGRDVYFRMAGRDWYPVDDPGLLGTALDVVEPRMVFFVGWSWKVAETITSAFECVNFHCTPLPYGRGGHPIENMILAGHTETVITAHRMTSELDAGPIYGTSGPISLAGTKEQILERFIEPCADLIRWIAETNPEPQPQVGEPTYFKRLSQEEYTQFWASRHG